MQKLQQFRKEIDRLDDRIVMLLKKRIQLAESVGSFKAESGNKVYDRTREKQILARLCSKKTGPLQSQELQTIYKKILQISRSHQHKFFRK